MKHIIRLLALLVGTSLARAESSQLNDLINGTNYGILKITERTLDLTSTKTDSPSVPSVVLPQNVFAVELPKHELSFSTVSLAWRAGWLGYMSDLRYFTNDEPPTFIRFNAPFPFSPKMKKSINRTYPDLLLIDEHLRKQWW